MTGRRTREDLQQANEDVSEVLVETGVCLPVCNVPESI